ncbi:MAG: chorismate synthase [Pseudomonadota bacterium]|nr:chorismate synthase [Pseudomonadota bacterium]
MTGSSIGQIFKVTTWGESHGEAIGCVIEGVPSNLDIDEKYIQKFLDRRKPGQSKFTTQRKEDDKIKILSGVFNKKTTGTPISLVIYNKDQKSKDYEEIKNKFRPGHADYTYHMKYGIRDYRGGGRASARETAMRVAAGAIAQKILGKKIKIRGALIQIGKKKINLKNWNWNEVNKNSFFCPDKKMVKKWEEYLLKIRKEGSSVGAIVQISATGIPVGLGEPVFKKIDALIAQAIMSIPAVKGVELGIGFKSAELRGEENADEMVYKNNKIQFKSNNAGGSLGGISSGQDIITKFVVKPTSSILTKKKTIDLKNKNTSIITKGRHDPCVGIRAVPVGEAMLAIVLADLYLLKKNNQI